MSKRWSVIWLFLLPLMSVACDPHHREQCEWYLVPEPSQFDTVEPGWVSLCARNYIVNRQKCYLRATLDYAKAVYGVPFRLSKMKVREIGPYPREVESIKKCTPEGAEADRRAKEAEQKKSDPASENSKAEDIED